MIAVSTTVAIYRLRAFNTVPHFVTLQMLFLNLNWPLSVAYSSVMIFENDKGLQNESNLANILATAGSLCLLVHEWLFTDQFLRATLLLDRKVIEKGA